MADLKEIGKQAKAARYILAGLDTDTKNKALFTAAECLEADAADILAENAKDLEAGRSRSMPEGLLDRLSLTQKRISDMAEGLRQVAALPDPVGEILDTFTRPNGLVISKRRVPLGVIGIIYESRPNVTADAFGLCFKAGNAVILKGGSDAIFSNLAIEKSLHRALAQCNIPETAVQLIPSTDRAVTQEMMRLNEFIDVLIPRGGAGLIKMVVENSTVPVIETGTGNCHIYVDADADFDMAIRIILNAKTQRVGVCNACESLVIHESICDSFLPKLYQALREKDVEIHADDRAFLEIDGCVPATALSEKSVEIRGDEKIGEVINCVPVTEEDYGTEYLALKLSVKTVSSLEEAIGHINRYNTGHSEAIITNNEAHARTFLDQVDAACVYVNASTRFTDGFEFGFGAEIGISTQMLHARGPMGLKELTSYKYTIRGNGQTRS